ncbi:MAG TPA: hypothetical protein VFM03_00930 [Candidatus Limnocylindria bacterium]|nr:hypothetical protein [Candidatus Limnocylindria bacterium]
MTSASRHAPSAASDSEADGVAASVAAGVAMALPLAASEMLAAGALPQAARRTAEAANTDSERPARWDVTTDSNLP